MEGDRCLRADDLRLASLTDSGTDVLVGFHEDGGARRYNSAAYLTPDGMRHLHRKLATGHLSATEVAWLLGEARRAGISRLLLTHPSYTVPAMSPAQAAELTDPGGYAEVTANQLLRQPGCDAARLAAFITAVGYHRVVLSSDAGQPDNPTAPEALQLLIDALAAEELDRQALLACASEIPERLIPP